MSGGITKEEMRAFVRTGGLTVTGEETFAELSEAVTHLVQAWKGVEKDVIEFVTVPFDTNEPYDVPCGSDFCTECKVEVTARWVDDEARWRCGNCFYPFAKEPEFGELCPGCFYAIAKKIRELD